MREHFQKNILSFQLRLEKIFNYIPSEQEIEERKDNIVMQLSPYLNIYGYPAELDYDDIVPRPPFVAQLEAFCREEPCTFTLPPELNLQPGEKLIYLSMGSMGSIDVTLMKRFLGILQKTPHKYIISKGQRGDEYELPANCWGNNYLPQTSILPLVDLVITHGGNNTTTETMANGKPMIVMPLFVDQYDNAQRVHEKGYGVRMEPYTFKEDELIETIERLLNDKKMAAKVKAAGERINKSDSKERVVHQIEDIVAKFKAEK